MEGIEYRCLSIELGGIEEEGVEIQANNQLLQEADLPAGIRGEMGMGGTGLMVD